MEESYSCVFPFFLKKRRHGNKYPRSRIELTSSTTDNKGYQPFYRRLKNQARYGKIKKMMFY